MSPLVQRSRPNPALRPGSADQHWSMLLFESLSAGVIAVGIGLAAVMLVVGVYVVIVWPLTFWDLAEIDADKYSGWVNLVLWSIFGGGTLAGYLCFSGAAFKAPKRKVLATVNRSQR